MTAQHVALDVEGREWSRTGRRGRCRRRCWKTRPSVSRSGPSGWPRRPPPWRRRRPRSGRAGRALPGGVPGAGQDGVVLVGGHDLPGVELDGPVGAVGVVDPDQPAERVVAGDRGDAPVDEVGLVVVDRAGVEERLVGLDRVALVVVDDPAGADPAGRGRLEDERSVRRRSRLPWRRGRARARPRPGPWPGRPGRSRRCRRRSPATAWPGPCAGPGPGCAPRSGRGWSGSWPGRRPRSGRRSGRSRGWWSGRRRPTARRWPVSRWSPSSVPSGSSLPMTAVAVTMPSAS